MKFNDQLTVSGQPSEQEIQALADEGFKSVVNFRTEGEEDQPLSPDAEAKKVKDAGLEYLHVPVSMDAMSGNLVDQFRARYQTLPAPVFAHCKSGKRAGAMMMMHVAVEQGMSGEQAIEQAKSMGFECDKPELEQFVRKYVDEHSKANA